MKDNDPQRSTGLRETRTSGHGQRRPITDDERAINELIGYVLAFAVIIAGVGLVSTLGVGVLEDIRNVQQENNAEQAFNVMAESFDEIERGEVPSRTAEIDLHDGRMTVKNTTAVEIRVTHDETSDFVTEVFPHSIELRPNSNDPTVLVYENGATIRGTNDTNQGVINNRPKISCSDTQAIVSVVRLNTSDNRQLGGGTVRITGTKKRTGLLYPVNRTGENSSRNVTDLRLTIESGFDKAWISYLDRNDDAWEKESNNEVVCRDIDRVFVRETVINVRFVR